jgi:hypothetical protein
MEHQLQKLMISSSSENRDTEKEGIVLPYSAKSTPRAKLGSRVSQKSSRIYVDVKSLLPNIGEHRNVESKRV